MSTEFDLLDEEVQVQRVGSRTETAAALAWFLVNVFRLEPEDVDDAICDGGGDKGIDALVVDDDAGEILVLQSKWRQGPGKTQGDADLKALVGAGAYFVGPESIDALLESGPNIELRNLLARQAVREKLALGTYAVRLVFVTNAPLDASGADYVAARTGQQPGLEVWDRDRLAEVAHRTRRADLRAEAVTLTAATAPTQIELGPKEHMAVAVVPALELVKLPGIKNRTLFSRNVRLFAGRTSINKDLAKTVRNPNEHRLFPAYHNGLTLLTEALTVDGTELALNGVGVVNGCQSLITLFENQDALTDDLRLLVKVVEVAKDNTVADKVTHRSNNQNSVTLRDQRSSDPVMRSLQTAVNGTFGSQFGLQIRVGEKPDADNVLENSLAAQLIMAVLLGEPWSAVRKVRLFDQEFRRIFSRGITPHRLFLLWLLDGVLADVRGDLRPDLRASYASVRFTLSHLLAQVLRESESGRLLLDSPERYLPGRREATEAALVAIAKDVVESVNFYIESETAESDGFDPKTVFKSKSGVGRLEHEVLRHARRQAARDPEYLFTVTPA